MSYKVTNEKALQKILKKEFFPEIQVVDFIAILRNNSEAIFLPKSNVILYDKSSAILRDSIAILEDYAQAELYGNSHAFLKGHSKAVLRYNSTAMLGDNSRAVLWDNSYAELWNHSYAELRGTSRSILWDNSRATLYDFAVCYVTAKQAVRKVSPKARIVQYVLPGRVLDWCKLKGIKPEGGKIKLWAVLLKDKPKSELLFVDSPVAACYFYNLKQLKDARLILVEAKLEDCQIINRFAQDIMAIKIYEYRKIREFPIDNIKGTKC